MSKDEHMTYFLKKDSYISSYAAFPRFLFRMEISETAKLIYVLLLDRARLSMKNEGWVNEFGHVFIYYTIEELAKDCGKSEMTVKNNLTVLEKAGLIYRQRQGAGLPNKLYVKVWTENETSRQNMNIIDDLGIERNTEFSREQVFNIVDSRYRSQLPMIFTTNLTPEIMRDHPELSQRRIFDRVVERCTAIRVNDQNIRKINGDATLAKMRSLFQEVRT